MKRLEGLKMRRMYTSFLSPIRIFVYIIEKMGGFRAGKLTQKRWKLTCLAFCDLLLGYRVKKDSR